MALGWIKDLLDIGGSGAQLYNAFRDAPENKAMTAFLEDQDEKRRLRNIALNPDSPEFLNYVKIDEEATRNDFVKAMSEALRRQNRAQARGQVMTRPERQDEFFNKVQSRLTSGPESRQRVQNKLMAAAGTPNYAPGIAPFQQDIQRQMTRSANRLTAPFAFGNSLLDYWSDNGRRDVPNEWVGVTPSRKPTPDDYPGFTKDESYSMWEY